MVLPASVPAGDQTWASALALSQVETTRGVTSRNGASVGVRTEVARRPGGTVPLAAPPPPKKARSLRSGSTLDVHTAVDRHWQVWAQRLGPGEPATGTGFPRRASGWRAGRPAHLPSSAALGGRLWVGARPASRPAASPRARQTYGQSRRRLGTAARGQHPGPRARPTSGGGGGRPMLAPKVPTSGGGEGGRGTSTLTGTLTLARYLGVLPPSPLLGPVLLTAPRSSLNAS